MIFFRSASLLWLLVSALYFYLQENDPDSLKKLLLTDKQDSSRLGHLNDLAWNLYGSNVDTCIILSAQALNLADELLSKNSDTLTRKGLKKLKAQTYHQLGWFWYLEGDYPRALDQYSHAIQLWKETGSRYGLAKSNGNIGIIYKEQGDYTRALSYYFGALKECEAIGDQRGVAINLANIGIVYKNQENTAKALECFTQALKICQQIRHETGVAANYGNLGNLYLKTGDLKKAEENYLKCMHHAEKIGYTQLLGLAVGNLGLVYSNQGMHEKSLEFFKKGLKLAEQMEDQSAQARNLSNLGDACRELKQYALSEQYLKKALDIASEIGALELLKDIHGHLSALYELTGKSKLALHHYQAHVAARDSLFNEENTKKTVQMEMQYEFDKKESAARLEQEKKDAVSLAEKRRQRIVLFSVSAFGFLILAFALFAWKSFLQKKRANTEILRQKHLIEEKQKEILDSIYYAKRIQASLMPRESVIDKQLKRLR